mmetsp:Transcript_782/g.1300  ORF Transcript_782/g.1300 Transcript_782/m.1300 type:complete len:105 (-) Transcript_782:152-466(-)
MSRELNKIQSQFWKLYTELNEDISCHSKAEYDAEPVTVEEIISNMDTYNPYGCYYYGGCLPAGPYEQLPMTTQASSRVWKKFYYANPKPLPSFKKFVKAVKMGE